MGTESEAERIDTVVVGWGQAGLSVGYHLGRLGVSHAILDANEQIGDAWRKRWDSLRLFTPARFNGLDGMQFPGPAHSFSTKDEMADYLKAYATRFCLRVHTGVRVTRLYRTGTRFLLEAGDRRFEANNVVVAMGSYQLPAIPQFADGLAPGIVQLHSSAYRNVNQLKDGRVLVVGVGNSGPRSPSMWRHVMFRVIGHRVLTVDTPVGRRMRPKLINHAAPVVRVKPADLAAAGVERVGRVIGTRDGFPVLEDKGPTPVENVIWCTGYRPDFSWIDLPIFGEDRGVTQPRHVRGIVADVPGLYFVGLYFLYAMSSGFVPGVGRDAQHVARQIATRR